MLIIAGLAALCLPAGANAHGPVSPSLLRAAGAVAASAETSLRSAWCGEADDPGRSGARPAVAVVYAVPSDAPSRLRRAGGLLQLAVREATRTVAAEAGGRKTIRFETGTSCGGDYLRIQLVRLSQPRAAYVGPLGEPIVPLVREEIKRALPPGAGPRNLLVFVDGLVDRPSGYSEILHADQPGPSNPHNAGGRAAFVWGTHRAPSALDVRAYAYLVLHEVTHSLGGVQRHAPNASGQFHCTDQVDVMCYDDGTGHSRQRSVCRPRPGKVLGAYDCNGDDYFNPSPAPGSYLATHWNVYDSVFLGSCAELRAACALSRPRPSRSPSRGSRRSRA